MAHVGFRSRTEGMVLRADGSSWKCSLVATGRTHPADATDRGLTRFGLGRITRKSRKKWGWNGETWKCHKNMGRFWGVVLWESAVFFFVVCIFFTLKSCFWKGSEILRNETTDCCWPGFVCGEIWRMNFEGTFVCVRWFFPSYHTKSPLNHQLGNACYFFQPAKKQI